MSNLFFLNYITHLLIQNNAYHFAILAKYQARDIPSLQNKKVINTDTHFQEQ